MPQRKPKREKPGPKPAAGVARTVVFAVRLTRAEKKRLDARARAAGLTPRELIRRGAAGEGGK